MKKCQPPRHIITDGWRYNATLDITDGNTVEIHYAPSRFSQARIQAYQSFSASHYSLGTKFFHDFTTNFKVCVHRLHHHTTMLYHAKLGCETIIEDYVKSKKLKFFSKLAISTTSYLFMILTAISLIYIISS